MNGTVRERQEHASGLATPARVTVLAFSGAVVLLSTASPIVPALAQATNEGAIVDTQVAPRPTATDRAASEFPYRVRRQGLEDVLRFYAERNGLGVVGKDLPATVIEGPIEARTEDEFLRAVAAAGGVDLFTFGGSLYASPVTARATKIVTAEVDGQDELEATLGRLGVPFDRFEVRFDPPTGLIALSGPPSFVELTSDILSRIERKPEPEPEPELSVPPPRQPAPEPPRVAAPIEPSAPPRPSVTVFRGASKTVVTP